MQYPQLDIRSLDPHVSPKVADMIRGTFYFGGMTHEQRIFRLSALNNLYRYVLDLGQLEHTGDWDWRITIAYGEDGAIASTAGTWDKDEDHYSWSDSFSIPFTIEPGDYADGFRRWTHITVEEIRTVGDLDEEVTVDVPIDQIRYIHIDEA